MGAAWCCLSITGQGKRWHLDVVKVSQAGPQLWHRQCARFMANTDGVLPALCSPSKPFGTSTSEENVVPSPAGCSSDSTHHHQRHTGGTLNQAVLCSSAGRDSLCGDILHTASCQCGWCLLFFLCATCSSMQM